LGLLEQRLGNPFIITVTRSLLTKKPKNLVVPGKATNRVLRENELPICDDIKDAVSALDQLRLGTDSNAQRLSKNRLTLMRVCYGFQITNTLL
jgi:hypothetical protein